MLFFLRSPPFYSFILLISFSFFFSFFHSSFIVLSNFLFLWFVSFFSLRHSCRSQPFSPYIHTHPPSTLVSQILHILPIPHPLQFGFPSSASRAKNSQTCIKCFGKALRKTNTQKIMSNPYSVWLKCVLRGWQRSNFRFYWRFFVVAVVMSILLLQLLLPWPIQKASIEGKIYQRKSSPNASQPQPITFGMCVVQRAHCIYKTHWMQSSQV